MTAFLRYAVALALLLAVAAPVPVFAFAPMTAPPAAPRARPPICSPKPKRRSRLSNTRTRFRCSKSDQRGSEERQRAELSRLQLSQDRSPGQSIERLRASARHQSNHRGANEYLGELYLELKQLDKAQERLNVLSTACNGCEEYTELKEKVDAFKNGQSS